MPIESVKEVFDRMPEVFDKSQADGVDMVFQFHITGEESGDWNVSVANSECSVSGGIHDNPTVILSLSDVDWLAMCNGKLNGMSAFMSGKLKVSGDIMASQRLQTLFPMG